ncbi:MAG: beta-galactosidase, partial [Planctomycetia bacterium]|nr:beta-galactosidase [Planctomycetia bacterium]
MILKNETLAGIPAGLVLWLVLSGTLPLPGTENVGRSEEPDPTSAYGVCAHVGGGEEFLAIPENFRRMREAGIRWVRADFSWIGVENPQGTWKFDHLDRVVRLAEENGITILPILNYDVPWATPAWKHPDAWKEYVTRTVSRYRDRIRYWEVWNEPNLKSFWRDEPNGANYARLLKNTAEQIREIDPELKIVYGGLAGVPLDYLEDSLRAGAGEAFDVMNIHPYRGGMVTMKLVNDFQKAIAATRGLMEKYGVGEKPVWITEMGWATPPMFGETNRRIVSGAMKILFPEGTSGTCAVLVDSRYPASEYYSTEILESLLPENVKTETISLGSLDGIDPETYPILLLPPGELFPTPYFESLRNYVKNGGTLFLLGGVPLYYETKWVETAVTDADVAADGTVADPGTVADGTATENWLE